MKTSEVLYKAAEHCERYGFSHRLYEGREGCGCFIRHVADAAAPTGGYDDAMTYLYDIVGGFGAVKLMDEGWTRKDATAALTIAADIAAAEGK